MIVNGHLIYYQRCLQNTTQIALRLWMTDLTNDVRMLQSLKRSNRTVVISSIWVFYLYLDGRWWPLQRDKLPAGIYSYNCDSCSCLLWQISSIPLPCYLNYHSSILSNNSTIVRSSNVLHLWIRLTLYQRIFLPVDVTEPWSRLFSNHWFWFCQFLSDVNFFCSWCCCHTS